MSGTSRTPGRAATTRLGAPSCARSSPRAEGTPRSRAGRARRGCETHGREGVRIRHTGLSDGFAPLVFRAPCGRVRGFPRNRIRRRVQGARLDAHSGLFHRPEAPPAAASRARGALPIAEANVEPSRDGVLQPGPVQARTGEVDEIQRPSARAETAVATDRDLARGAGLHGRIELWR